MVDFPIDVGIRRIADEISTKTVFQAGDPWFGVDPIKIILSSSDVLATIVVDFDIEELLVVEYTLNGIDFVAFNNGVTLSGRQSRFIDVTNGAEVNFRSPDLPVTVVRVAVCSTP